MNTERLKSYFMDDLGWGWGFQQEVVFNFLCRAADQARGGVVLDAGAGQQRYQPFFQDSIYLAQEHPIAGRKNKGLREFDILTDVRRIPLRDASIDLVLSTSTLEHLEYPDAFFAESLRVLRPGGSLFVHAPFVYFEHEIPYDFQRLTRYGLQRYYVHAGFERVKVAPTSSSFYTAQYFFLAAIREDGARLGRSLCARVLRRILFPTAEFLCRWATRLLDRGPHDDTTLPVGWVAEGYKSGDRRPGPDYASKEEFIQSKADCDSSIWVKEGRIVPRE